MTEGKQNELRHGDNTRPMLAALLSFTVPGLGQVYNRETGKGVLIFLLSFLFIPYVYGIVDAYLTARRQQRHYLVAGPPAPRMLPPAPSLEMQLVSAANRRGGELSVTEGVMETGRTFEEVEGKLDQLYRAGYVDIGNREESGVVIYRFSEVA